MAEGLTGWLTWWMVMEDWHSGGEWQSSSLRQCSDEMVVVIIVSGGSDSEGGEGLPGG